MCGLWGRRGEESWLVYLPVTVACPHIEVYALFISLPAVPENMYVYEGKDYSKSSDADKRTFDQLLAGRQCLFGVIISWVSSLQHTRTHARTHICTHTHTHTHTHTEQLKITEGSLSGRVLRSEHQVTLPTSLPLPEQRKRKQLTPAQLEERRRKVGMQLITPPSFTLHTHILTLTLSHQHSARRLVQRGWSF